MVLLLTDHDVMGRDMERDIRERLEMYAGGKIDVRRLAITRPQALRYNLPEDFDAGIKGNAAYKKRYREFVAEHGRGSWELDALRPTVISNLIRTEIERLIDHTRWDASQRKERRNRKLLERVAANWPKVKKLVAPQSPKQLAPGCR